MDQLRKTQSSTSITYIYGSALVDVSRDYKKKNLELRTKLKHLNLKFHRI